MIKFLEDNSMDKTKNRKMKKVKHNYLNKKNKKSSCKIFLKKELKIEKTIISQKLKKEKLIKK